jgi:hypothetical protein
LVENNPDIDEWFLNEFYERLSHDIDPKSHTIRAHKKPLKVGELINPKCWAGRPYNKTKEGYWKIKFAPDIEVKKQWDFEVKTDIDYSLVTIDDWNFYEENEHFVVNGQAFETLAKNDGLSLPDLKAWFKWPEPSGEMQIICWNENIEY